jgi:hypothetical protein
MLPARAWISPRRGKTSEDSKKGATVLRGKITAPVAALLLALGGLACEGSADVDVDGGNEQEGEGGGGVDIEGEIGNGEGEGGGEGE